MLGAQVMCTHYEAIFDIAGQVPVILAYGNVNLGKSKAAEAAQAMLGLSSEFTLKKNNRQAGC